MQKKLIALAVAGLVSGAAFAQSNVTIYGIADAAYVYGSDSYVNGTKASSSLFSGGQSGSRLGFKGMEDLGNGLSANFRFESGIAIDNGTNTQGGRAWGRWSTVGLAGKNWGEVQFGRRDTFMDEMIGGFDVTGRSTTSQASPIMKDNSRYSNMFAYISPTMSGFQVKLGASTAAWDAAEVEPLAAKSNVRVMTGGVSYINGPLKVGGTYEWNKQQSTNTTSFDAGSQWVLATAYDFGVVALSAEYGQIKAGNSGFFVDPTNANSLLIEKRKQWTIGAAVPIGANDKVTLQYARGTNERINNLSDEKAHMWGVSYFHTLSKRTNVYAGYGQVSNDGGNTVNYGIDSQGTYQKALMVGMRHQF